jgi:enoyl-[acyl-carrier protein] reductase III
MFEKKIVLITGGSRGIGRALSLKFSRLGATVLINFLQNTKKAEETQRLIQKSGKKCLLYQSNLNNPEEISQMMSKITDDFGRLDILVHNAALGVFKPTLQIRTNQWDLSMNINARALLLLAKKSIKLMKNGGNIIGISSLGSHRVAPNYGAIGISKAALESLIRYLAVEMAPYNIRVNGVAGGIIKTESIKKFPEYEKATAMVLKNIPAKRLGMPDDIANAVIQLVSDEASWIYGQIFVVDGGQSLI